VTIVVGVAAGLVQGARPPALAVCRAELARRWVAADAPASDPTEADATRRSIEVTFAILHRYLGVGVGEHWATAWPAHGQSSWRRRIVTTGRHPGLARWIGALVGSR
jgi:hypothetical protein